jgi:hypothetical protein
MDRGAKFCHTNGYVTGYLKAGVLAKIVCCKTLERTCVMSQLCILVLPLCTLLGEAGKSCMTFTSGVTIFIYSLLVTMIEAEVLMAGKE